MGTLKIAFRNIFRNTRRSLMTVLAIAVGALAILLFGGFVTSIILGFQTDTVQRLGHLAIFRAGFFDFGNGNPSAYAIDDYAAVMKTIAGDEILAPKIAVTTPTVQLFGIAGNFAANASRTFFGAGIVPSDQEKMLLWNEYELSGLVAKRSGLRDDDPEGGVIGVGLSRILALCQALHVSPCPTPPPAPEADDEAKANPAILDLGTMAAEDRTDGIKPDPRPRIDLLAATAGGAPNVVSLYVNRAEGQGAREVDNAYVGMHLALAQKLVFGRGAPKVTGITLQLHRTEDIGPAKARLAQIFAAHNLPLEVREFTDLQPTYGQVLGMFAAIFSFISLIMAVIVLFTVVNTMSMSVMERVNEIGTLRALGVRRAGVRRQFVAEGWILGMIGATVGVLAALAIAAAVNRAHLTWMPPSNSEPVPLSVMLSGNPVLLTACWIALVAVATLAALVPANRAARLPVVDALRHV